MPRGRGGLGIGWGGLRFPRGGRLPRGRRARWRHLLHDGGALRQPRPAFGYRGQLRSGDSLDPQLAQVRFRTDDGRPRCLLAPFNPTGTGALHDGGALSGSLHIGKYI